MNIRIGDSDWPDDGDDWRPWAGFNEYWGESGRGFWKDDEMKLPRLLSNADPDTGDHIEIVVHELGHYVFDFYDEYAHYGFEELESTLMDNERWYMSYQGLYEDRGDPDTQQMHERDMSC